MIHSNGFAPRKTQMADKLAVLDIRAVAVIPVVGIQEVVTPADTQVAIRGVTPAEAIRAEEGVRGVRAAVERTSPTIRSCSR